MANVSERELFVKLIDTLAQARDCMRGLGLSRNDRRWIGAAGLIDRIKDNATHLMQKPSTHGDKAILLLPPHLRN